MVNVAADADVLDEKREAFVHALRALDVHLEALGFGNAAVGLDDLAFPFPDGVADVFHLELNGGLRRGQLLAGLAPVNFRQLLAALDVRVELDDLGMFGTQVFAEALALELEQLDFLEGGLVLGRGGGRGSAEGGGDREVKRLGVGGGVGGLGQRGRGQQPGLEFEVGQLGLEPGQVAAGDAAFLFDDGQVVGPLENHQGVLLELEVAFGFLHLLGDRGQRVARDLLPDILLYSRYTAMSASRYARV